ncbi:MAG: tryptophan synthase subunit alpha [Oscillospiraceae bacterium]|nr:tryptophan synthase subunit alpha [Oscillospiraceae bacterium]
MSRIASLKGKKCFVSFLTGGDPNLDKTYDYILDMAEAGADLIEIGVPFSDPIAEGIVIQEANIRALSVGTTTDGIFDCVEKVRKKTDVPLVLLTYANPVYTYGKDRFFGKCEEVGIDGVIVPDVPFEEKAEFSEEAKAHNIDIISMIAPTSDERITKIASEAQGFLYIVSSMGVTGVREKITTDVKSIVEKAKAATDIPVFVGFGISTPGQVKEYTSYADGAIVGSAIVKIIAKNGENASQELKKYVSEMKAGTEQ